VSGYVSVGGLFHSLGPDTRKLLLLNHLPMQGTSVCQCLSTEDEFCAGEHPWQVGSRLTGTREPDRKVILQHCHLELNTLSDRQPVELPQYWSDVVLTSCLSHQSCWHILDRLQTTLWTVTDANTAKSYSSLGECWQMTGPLFRLCRRSSLAWLVSAESRRHGKWQRHIIAVMCVLRMLLNPNQPNQTWRCLAMALSAVFDLHDYIIFETGR